METVKRHIASLVVAVLLFQSLIPNGLGFSKDFAFGEIVSHYLEHKDEANGDLAFLDFLSLHYASDSDHRDQNPDDLPNLDGNFIATFLILNSDFGKDFQVYPIVLFLDQVHSKYSNTYCFDFSQDLIHPPVI